MDWAKYSYAGWSRITGEQFSAIDSALGYAPTRRPKNVDLDRGRALADGQPMSALFDRDDIERAQTKPLPKPSHVEKWQRWRMRAKPYRVLEVRDHGMATLERTDKPGTLVSRSQRGLIESTDWEYLGMSDMKSPVYKTVADVGRSASAEDHAWAQSMAEWRIPDPAPVKPAETNEQVAKRLIADPPPWAYPTAWMRAVLAMQDWFASRGSKGALGAYEHYLPTVCQLAHQRKPWDFNSQYTHGALHEAYTCYSRAMDHKPWSVTTKPVNQKFRRVR